MTLDYSFAENPDRPETLLAHRPDCPDVRAQADRGEMVATMFDCAERLPDDIPRHECLDGLES